MYMDKLFEIENLRCSYDRNYREGESRVVLEIPHLEIPRGCKVFIVGESGIGKSTILETLGLMNNTVVHDNSTVFRFYDTPATSLDIMQLWADGDDAVLSGLRRRHFNFIFQNTNLMRNFTAFENITFTRMLQGYDRASSYKKAKEVLQELGLGSVGYDRMAHELSGGQQQRLAFARAIIPDFTVLFGDEPTGNLDSDNAMKAIRLLSDRLDADGGASAIIVTHDMHLAVTFGDVIIKIRKCRRTSAANSDEVMYYGVIDSACVFTPDDARSVWSSSDSSYPAQEFESFLKRG